MALEKVPTTYYAKIMNSDQNPWKINKSKRIYDNPWIGLTEHQVIDPSGANGIYSVVEFKNLAIGIIPLDYELNTWIVGQFRFPINRYSWEIPEGGGDPLVDPRESALKELREETGLRAATLEPILEMDLSNSATDERAIIFVARDLTEGLSEPEPTEQLTIRKLPFEELFQMVLRGEITDSLTVAGVLKLKILLDSDALNHASAPA